MAGELVMNFAKKLTDQVAKLQEDFFEGDDAEAVRGATLEASKKFADDMDSRFLDRWGGRVVDSLKRRFGADVGLVEGGEKAFAAKVAEVKAAVRDLAHEDAERFNVIDAAAEEVDEDGDLLADEDWADEQRDKLFDADNEALGKLDEVLTDFEQFANDYANSIVEKVEERDEAIEQTAADAAEELNDLDEDEAQERAAELNQELTDSDNPYRVVEAEDGGWTYDYAEDLADEGIEWPGGPKHLATISPDLRGAIKTLATVAPQAGDMSDPWLILSAYLAALDDAKSGDESAKEEAKALLQLLRHRLSPHRANLATSAGRLRFRLGWSPAQTRKGGIKAVGNAEQAGKTLYGEAAKRALGMKKGARQERAGRAEKAHEIVRKIFNQEDLDDSHIQQFADHASAMTVDQLRRARQILAARFGGARKHADLVNALREHVRGQMGQWAERVKEREAELPARESKVPASVALPKKEAADEGQAAKQAPEATPPQTPEAPKEGDRNAEGLIFKDGRWHREDEQKPAESSAPATEAVQSPETPKEPERMSQTQAATPSPGPGADAGSAELAPATEDDGPSWEELTAGALAEMLPKSENPASSPRESTSSSQQIPSWFQRAYENT